MLENKELTAQLKTVIHKSLEMTEEWMSDVNQIEEKKRSTINEEESKENESNFENFKYSVDESNFQIPEFMKNDLERLKQSKIEGDINVMDEELKETRQGKIRNSIYFIISRGIKFGKETDLASYLLV